MTAALSDNVPGHPERIARDIMDTATENLVRSGCVEPLFLVLRRGEPICSPFAPDGDRGAQYAGVFRKACEVGAFAVMNVCEVWIAPDAGKDGRVRPSEHPKRREAVRVEAYFNGLSLSLIREFRRGDDGRPVPGEKTLVTMILPGDWKDQSWARAGFTLQ